MIYYNPNHPRHLEHCEVVESALGEHPLLPRSGRPWRRVRFADNRSIYAPDHHLVTEVPDGAPC